MDEVKMKPLDIPAMLQALNSVEPYLGRGDDAGKIARQIDLHADGFRGALQDAEKWRKAREQMGVLVDAAAGEEAAVLHACVSFIGYRAHVMKAQKATFKLEGLKSIDGVEAGDWRVTVERLNDKEPTNGQ